MWRALADRHGAQVTCPIYTGYHLRTVAEVACEAVGRVIDAQAPLARKLPCGLEFIRARRREESLSP